MGPLRITRWTGGWLKPFRGLRATRVLAEQLVDQPNWRIIVIDRNSWVWYVFVHAGANKNRRHMNRMSHVCLQSAPTHNEQISTCSHDTLFYQVMKQKLVRRSAFADLTLIRPPGSHSVHPHIQRRRAATPDHPSYNRIHDTKFRHYIISANHPCTYVRNLFNVIWSYSPGRPTTDHSLRVCNICPWRYSTWSDQYLETTRESAFPGAGNRREGLGETFSLAKEPLVVAAFKLFP